MYILRLARIQLDLLPKPSDMYIHCSGIPRIIHTPYKIQQILTAVDFVRIHGKKLQHIIFFCCQIDLTLSDKHSSALTVDPHIAFDQNLGSLRTLLFSRSPSHDRFDPGLDFQNIERLRNIIIRSVLQPEYLVHILTFGSQHDDRHVGKLTDGLTNLKPIHLREHHIQQHEVILAVLCILQCFLTVIGTVHLHVVLFQTEPYPFHDQLFIVNY